MGRIVFFILVLFSGICSVNATPTIEVVNTLKDYKVFLYEFENAKGDEQKQLAAWENYEKKYEYLFSKDAFDLNRNNDKLEDLKKYFKKLPEIKNKVLELYPKANQVVLKSAESFSKVFKDFKDSNIVIKVYLISSSKKMNGYATTIEGNPVVLLGMDGTVMIGQNEKDVEFVFAHELHHIYWGRIKHGDDDKDSFDVALWFEGFATYASGLVTGFSDDVVLSDSWLAEKCKDPAYVKKLAKKYKNLVTKVWPKIKKNNDEKESRKIYKYWFGSIGNETKENPSRSGYCLGLHVVKILASNNSLDDMVEWKGTELTNKIRLTLDYIIDK